MARALRYRGPLKVVEQTGAWGVYLGERIVLGDGRAVDDDLGVKIREAFAPGDAEWVELEDVEITVRTRGRWRLGRRRSA